MEKQAELNTLKAKFILFSSQLQIYFLSFFVLLVGCVPRTFNV